MKNRSPKQLSAAEASCGSGTTINRLANSYLSVADHFQSLNLHVHSLQHGVGVSIHVDLLLGQGRHGGNEVQTTLSLLLLKLQGDATNRSSLDSLHQVLRHQHIVPEPTVTYPAILLRILLEGKSAHSSTIWVSPKYHISHSLVVIEVQSQLLVVLLDDVSGSLLDSLGTHATLQKGEIPRFSSFNARTVKTAIHKRNQGTDP